MVENIWYISKYAINPRHGKPSRQYYLCKYFAKKGRKVKLISSRSAGLNAPPRFLKNSKEVDEIEEGFSHVLLNGLDVKLGFNFRRLWSWFTFEIRLLIWALTTKSSRPDVIIVSSLSVLSFLTGSLLKHHFGCKLVCEVRDIWPLTIIETNNMAVNNPFVKFLSFAEKIGYKNADVIIGTMPNLKEHVKQISPDAAKKVKHVPMGYDPIYFKETERLVNDPFKKVFKTVVPPENFTVGYAGSIGKVNCVEQIIESARLLSAKPITFLILGDGPLKTKLEQTVIDEGIQNVVFIDAVKKEFVNLFLKKCDLLINPIKDSKKLYQYGVSPNKWIDYMYSGRPILVSYNGFKSIINEADCGKFCKADDPVSLAQNIEAFSKMDIHELDEMGERGKQFLFNYLNYDNLSKNYLAFIENDVEIRPLYMTPPFNKDQITNLEPRVREKILEEQLG